VTKSKSRLQVLDALRGIAALGVVLYHFTSLFSQRYQYVELQILFPLPHENVGRYGVELFFIISGFVITMSLSRCDNVTQFLISRFSRLFPTFWVSMTITSLVILWASGSGNIYQYLVNLTMMPTLFGVDNVDGSYWTLLYELVFYFLIAVIFKYSNNKISTPLMFGYLLLGVGAIALFYWWQVGIEIPFKLRILFMFPHFHLFIAGFLFHKMWVARTEKRRVEIHIVLGVLGLLLTQWLLIFTNEARINVLSSTCVTVFFGTFICVIYGKLDFLNNKALLYLGSISYSLYLIHQEIGYVLIDFMYTYSQNALISIGFGLVVIIVIAGILHKYVEQTSSRFVKEWLQLKLVT